MLKEQRGNNSTSIAVLKVRPEASNMSTLSSQKILYYSSLNKKAAYKTKVNALTCFVLIEFHLPVPEFG